MTILDEFITLLAQFVARERGWTLEEATNWVLVRVAAARDEYRDKGAPLGDTDAGFVAWLAPRKQPPTA
jgi:hypothetical protein